MRSIFVIVCLAFHLTTVSAISRCVAATRCNDKFVGQAQSAANDQDIYCMYVREKISCLENSKGLCTPEQYQWVQDDIRTTRHSDPQCDSAQFVKGSMIGSMVLALITIFLVHH